MVFSEAEDTLTARLQHQLLKLRNILKAQNQMLTQEKEQIKTLISDISHQIKTPVAAANTFAQLLGDTGLSDEERSEYIATLQMSLEKLTFLTNSLIKMSRLIWCLIIHLHHTNGSGERLQVKKNIRIIIYLRRGRRISPRQTGSQSLEVLHGNMYPLSENGICIYLM